MQEISNIMILLGVIGAIYGWIVKDKVKVLGGISILYLWVLIALFSISITK